MFGIGSFYFKQKAKAALKGNWQTAMLVAFFSTVFMTALEVYQLRFMQVDANKLTALMTVVSYTQLWQLLGPVKEVLLGFAIIALLALLVTPALALGCNNYFIKRIQGEELGFAGLFSRFCIFFKALWLHFLIALKTFLWGMVVMVPVIVLMLLVPEVSLFLVQQPLAASLVSIATAIPIILASLRYAMAPYIMAEKPDTGAWKAIEQSKAMMKTQKMNYVSLTLSFVGWLLLSSVLQMMLGSISFVVGMMAQLFLQTWITAYMNGALACFYLTIAQEDGMDKAFAELNKMLRQMGADMPEGFPAPPFPDREESGEIEPTDDEAQVEDSEDDTLN